MSALDKVVDTYMGALPTFKAGSELQEQARAELTALRAIIKEQEHDIETVKHHEAVVIDNYQRTVAEQALALNRARKIIADVAPAEPMNQDEQGGCVWCGGRPKKSMYATSDPKHHSADCAWLLARAWLAANAPEQEQKP